MITREEILAEGWEPCHTTAIVWFKYKVEGNQFQLALNDNYITIWDSDGGFLDLNEERLYKGKCPDRNALSQLMDWLGIRPALEEAPLKSHLFSLGWVETTVIDDFVFFPTFAYENKKYNWKFTLQMDLQYGGEGTWLIITKNTDIRFSGIIRKNTDIDFLMKAIQIDIE